LSDVDRQRYIDKLKSLDIDKCPDENPRTEWMDDYVAPQTGVGNKIKTITSYC